MHNGFLFHKRIGHFYYTCMSAILPSPSLPLFLPCAAVPEEKKNLGLVIGASVAVGVAGLVVGALIGAVATYYILKNCCKGDHNISRQRTFSNEDTVPSLLGLVALIRTVPLSVRLSRWT